jgi:hypothetical protein
VFHNVHYVADWTRERSIFSVWDFESRELSPLPIPYSKLHFEYGGDLGYLGQVQVSPFQPDDGFVYSFSGESNIYKYLTNEEHIVVYGGAAKGVSNVVSTFRHLDRQDERLWKEHMIENTHFYLVHYDRHRQLYYRFHTEPISFRNGKYFNTTMDKPLVLMVFNKAFEVLGEYRFPPAYYNIGFMFVSEKGLHVAKAPERQSGADTRMILHLFRFEGY